jgi:hypothetical protein
VLIATSIEYPANTSALFASWTEQVSNQKFKGCAKLLGKGTGTEPTFNFLAYQKNVHRRVSERGDETFSAYGDSVELVGDQDVWRRGSRCKKITHKPLKLSAQTQILVSPQHKARNDWDHAMATWVEYQNDNSSESVICAQSVELFGSRRRSIDLNWLAVNTAPTTNSSVDVKMLTNTPESNDGQAKLCTDLPSYSNSRVTMTGVKVMDSTMALNETRNCASLSQVEYHNSTMASGCQKTFFFPMTTAQNSSLQAMSFVNNNL